MSKKLDFKAPHGIVYGHDTIRYSQNGKHYDGAGTLIPEPSSTEQQAEKPKLKDTKPQDDRLAGAKAFLKHILKENPLSKSVIYKTVESENQVWNDVRDAAVELGIVKSVKSSLEMWELPEELK